VPIRGVVVVVVVVVVEVVVVVVVVAAVVVVLTVFVLQCPGRQGFVLALPGAAAKPTTNSVAASSNDAVARNAGVR
jgi:hypothetical protein